jgi:hypothetical protein
MKLRIGRFPIEPNLDEFKSTAYNINSAGIPRYYAVVTNSYHIPGQGENIKVNDVFVVSGEYSDGNVILNRNDGNDVSIDMSSVTEWYEGD